MGKEKVQFVLKLLRMVLCVAIVVLAILAWTGIFTAGLSAVIILLGITMFIYGLEYWNESKLLAGLCFMVTVFIFICVIGGMLK